MYHGKDILMKKLLSLALALCLALSLAACGGQKGEITVFAAASMTETMDEIIEMYKDCLLYTSDAADE